MEEKKLELYYDHYKDTFQQQVRYIDNRNKYFFISIILVGLLFVSITDSKTVINVIDSLIKKEISDKFIFDFGYINHFLLFGLLWVLILYFQTTLTIEKQYKYLSKLEDDLTNLFTPLSISREGKFYLKVKPQFVRLVSKIYKVFFPISIVFAVLTKLYIEMCLVQTLKSLSFWIDFVLCLVIVLLTSLYFYWQNVERKRK